MAKKLYRQGDIVLEKLEGVCLSGKPNHKLEMHGETGKTHTLVADVYAPPTDSLFEHVVFIPETGAEMTHVEHPVLKIDPGVYGVYRAKNYAPTKREKIVDVDD